MGIKDDYDCVELDFGKIALRETLDLVASTANDVSTTIENVRDAETMFVSAIDISTDIASAVTSSERASRLRSDRERTEYGLRD